MNVRLPYSPRKRYLTGIDWMVGTLGQMTRAATGRNNTFQVVLELAGPLDAAAFARAFRAFAAGFPVLWGRSARCWTLAPYWRMPAPGAPRPPVPVEVVPLPAGASRGDVFDALGRLANAALPARAPAVAASVVQPAGGPAFLAFEFDHRVFDARGAEMFLALFQRHAAGEDLAAELARIPATEPAHLDLWRRRFLGGQKVNRLLREMSGAGHRALPRPPGGGPKSFRFRVRDFDAPSSAALVERAYREAGYLMLMPHLLSVFAAAVEEVMAARGVRDRAYVVSVSTDRRDPRDPALRLFFNHLTFLFFRFDAAAARDTARVAGLVRRRMLDQIRDGLPQAVEDASLLMRILPQPLLARFLHAIFRGEFSSFGLTCLGDSGCAARPLLGVPVRNLLHLPLMPVPPGIGLVANRFGDRVNLVLTYLEGMLSDAEAGRILAALGDGRAGEGP